MPSHDFLLKMAPKNVEAVFRLMDQFKDHLFSILTKQLK